MINYPSWNYDISFFTVGIITVSVIIFSIGSNLGKSLSFKSYLSPEDDEFVLDEYKYDFSFFTYAVLCSLCLLVTAVYFYHQYTLSISLGNTAGIMGIIGTIRSYILTKPEVFQLGVGLNIGISFLRAFGYVSLYNLVIALLCKDRKPFKYIIPIVCLIIYFILTTGRGPFIGFFSALLFDVVIVQKKRGKEISNKKIIKITLLSFVLFILLFFILGNIIGKGGMGFWDSLSIYAGSSIICFDNAINNPISYSPQFGQSLFAGVYNILRTLGFDVASQSMHAEFFYWGGRYESNVYTSFMPFIKDFGFVISIILQFPLGLLSGIFWREYYNGSRHPLLTITFGRFFAGAFVMYSISENFLSTVLSMNALAEIAFYFMIFLLLKKKKNLGIEIMINAVS